MLPSGYLRSLSSIYLLSFVWCLPQLAWESLPQNASKYFAMRTFTHSLVGAEISRVRLVSERSSFLRRRNIGPSNPQKRWKESVTRRSFHLLLFWGSQLLSMDDPSHPIRHTPLPARSIVDSPFQKIPKRAQAFHVRCLSSWTNFNASYIVELSAWLDERFAAKVNLPLREIPASYLFQPRQRQRCDRDWLKVCFSDELYVT